MKKSKRNKKLLSVAHSVDHTTLKGNAAQNTRSTNMTKNFTVPMMLTFGGGIIGLVLLGAINLYALHSGSGVTPIGINLLSNYTTTVQNIASGMFASFFTLIVKETGVSLPTVPQGSTATETTQVTSTQKVETPAVTETKVSA